MCVIIKQRTMIIYSFSYCHCASWIKNSIHFLQKPVRMKIRPGETRINVWEILKPGKKISWKNCEILVKHIQVGREITFKRDQWNLLVRIVAQNAQTKLIFQTFWNLGDIDCQRDSIIRSSECRLKAYHNTEEKTCNYIYIFQGSLKTIVGWRLREPELPHSGWQSS